MILETLAAIGIYKAVQASRERRDLQALELITAYARLSASEKAAADDMAWTMLSEDERGEILDERLRVALADTTEDEPEDAPESTDYTERPWASDILINPNA